MKTFLTLAALGLFSAAIVGCEASARVGDPDQTTTSNRDDASYSKKTVIQPDGDRKTTITEEHH